MPRQGYVLSVQDEDGRAGLFDVGPYLDSEAFAPLKDRHAFEAVRSGGYFVEWECGADLSADTIQARWIPLAADGAGEVADASRS
jgi:hypothetical protein